MMETSRNNFLQTLGAMMAVAIPIAAISWFIASSVFVPQIEYYKAQQDQAVTNVKVSTSVEQLNERLKTLNIVLERIQYSQPGTKNEQRR
jgi:p-aminobenzoyl-glutamate transporter AbgT